MHCTIVHYEKLIAQGLYLTLEIKQKQSDHQVSQIQSENQSDSPGKPLPHNLTNLRDSLPFFVWNVHALHFRLRVQWTGDVRVV